jgi:hypothetical protein
MLGLAKLSPETFQGTTPENAATRVRALGQAARELHRAKYETEVQESVGHDPFADSGFFGALGERDTRSWEQKVAANVKATVPRSTASFVREIENEFAAETDREAALNDLFRNLGSHEESTSELKRQHAGTDQLNTRRLLNHLAARGRNE